MNVPRRPPGAESRFWLVKSEPEAFSWQDLATAPKQTTCWDGVRNYQARNNLRDGMRLGERVLFYQSCTVPLGIVGTMVVVREGYPDPTQFDPAHVGFDPASPPNAPRWFAVDLKLERKFARVVTLAEMRGAPQLEGMPLLQKGSRLSVQPVGTSAFAAICAFGAMGH